MSSLPARPRLESHDLSPDEAAAFEIFHAKAFLAFRRGGHAEAHAAVDALFEVKRFRFVDASTPIEQIILDKRTCSICRNAGMDTFGAALARRRELKQISETPRGKKRPVIKSIGPQLAAKILDVLEAAKKRMRR